MRLYTFNSFHNVVGILARCGGGQSSYKCIFTTERIITSCSSTPCVFSICLERNLEICSKILCLEIAIELQYTSGCQVDETISVDYATLML